MTTTTEFLRVPRRKGRTPAGQTTLTPRRLFVLRLLARWLETRGVWPTFRDLAEEMGVNINAAVQHVRALTRLGLVVNDIHGIRLVGARPVLTYDPTPEGERLRGLLEAPP